MSLWLKWRSFVIVSSASFEKDHNFVLFSLLIDSFQIEQNLSNLSRYCFRPASDCEIKTRSSAHKRLFIAISFNMPGSHDGDANVGRALTNRLKSSGLRLQPCRTPQDYLK